MASPAAGDPTLPPLTEPVGRIVLPFVAPPVTREIAERWAASHDAAVLTVPLAGSRPVVEPLPGDRYVHTVPDVFGRVGPPPVTISSVVVAHRWVRLIDEPIVRVGSDPPADLDELLRDLHMLRKPLLQRRGVRALFSTADPFGIAFIAPDGLEVPAAFEASSEADPGLPDLVVVRPSGFWRNLR